MKRFGRLAALFTAVSVLFAGCNAPSESASKVGVKNKAVPDVVYASRETAAPVTEEKAETKRRALSVLL